MSIMAPYVADAAEAAAVEALDAISVAVVENCEAEEQLKAALVGLHPYADIVSFVASMPWRKVLCPLDAVFLIASDDAS